MIQSAFGSANRVRLDRSRAPSGPTVSIGSIESDPIDRRLPSRSATRVIEKATRPCDPASVPELAFPYDHRAPAHASQFPRFSAIPGAIRDGLRVPVGDIRGRALPAVLAGMRVPEASVHEYRRLAPGKREVWPPRKVPRMERVTVSQGVERPTDGRFRRRILLAYPPHKRAALLSFRLVLRRRHWKAGR